MVATKRHGRLGQHNRKHQRRTTMPCSIQRSNTLHLRGYTVRKFHRMIDESINLGDAISDIDEPVNSVVNAGKHWELDSSNLTFI